MILLLTFCLYIGIHNITFVPFIHTIKNIAGVRDQLKYTCSLIVAYGITLNHKSHETTNGIVQRTKDKHCCSMLFFKMGVYVLVWYCVQPINELNTIKVDERLN